MTNDKDSAVKDVIDRWYDSEVRQPAQSEGKINSNGKNERVSEVAASIRSALYRACPHMPRYPVGIVEPILAAFRQPTQSDALREALAHISFSGADGPYGVFGEALNEHQMRRVALAALQEQSNG